MKIVTCKGLRRGERTEDQASEFSRRKEPLQGELRLVAFSSKILVDWGASLRISVALNRETLPGKRGTKGFWYLRGLCHGLGARGARNAKPVFPLGRLPGSGALRAAEEGPGDRKGKFRRLAVFRESRAGT